MRTHWCAGWLLVILLGLSGCRSRVATTEETTVPEDTTTHLGDKIDIALADWLKLPRAEQAKLVEEWTETVDKQRAFARGNVESVRLLPRLHPPVVAAVFAKAKFSPTAGFSLPPYLKEGQKDAAVALHLARFGDREAALKLADSADKDLLAKIDACRGEREYPVEWTRLVALVLQNAELKLANGEPDGATELVLLHRQLRSLLDAKSPSTGGTPVPLALRAALLPRGRQALTLAAAAWREPRHNKTALAADIDTALANWGAMPEAVPGLSAGAKQSEVVSLMGSEVQGRAVLAQTPLAVQRSLDLFALPLPSEGANGVAAFLDGKHTLTEVQIVYRAKLNQLFPEPQQLALPLVEHGFASDNPASSPGLTRQSWTVGGLVYEVAVLTRGSVGGALVRVRRKDDGARSVSEGKSTLADATGSATRNPRDFGAVNLDRSFEQNRLGLAPDQAGTTLEIKDAAELTRIAQPATKFALASAVLKREADADLLARLTLRWPADQNSNALGQLVLPLWAAYGPSRLESAEETNGGRFTLTWQDETTRLRLHLPFEDKSPELWAEDSRGSAALKTRVETVAAFDRQERQQRFAARKPRERLSRSLQLPSHGIDDLRLGATREQVQTALPGARSLRVQPLSDGLNIFFLNEPPATATYWPRQLFVRFGADNRVAEIRVRYQEGPHAPGPKAPGLLDKLRGKPNGVPETLPAPWAGLWTDLSTRKQPVFYRWRDDVTCLTYQRDVGGSEVTLRDCPRDKPQNVELPPLLFCGRGIEGCVLGEAQDEVRKRWQVRRPLLASNGAEVLVLPANSPYDVLLVWYDHDKVSRLIARHRNPKSLKEEKVMEALQQAWGADLDLLGYVRRQDGARGQVLRAYGFHDDRTRVRLFAQETQEGIRLFTEWREWPVPAQTLASK
ncbi:MAG TPA: hypothetical protein VMF69_01380 [Gemmataceae bacterium]|nr:hypothetical protein [Gemmataceae bacterium]